MFLVFIFSHIFLQAKSKHAERYLRNDNETDTNICANEQVLLEKTEIFSLLTESEFKKLF